MRLTFGIHQRSNSVLPLHYLGTDVQKDITKVEQFYEARSYKVRFQIAEYCDPPELDAILEELNYEKVASTAVMTISATRINKLVDKFESPKNDWYHSLSQKNGDWIDNVAKFGKFSDSKINEKIEIIENIKREKGFYNTRLNDETIAIALTVVENMTMGLFEVAVKPSMRRNGVGRELMIYILSRAIKNDIECVYLQVENSNIAAKSLYKQLGFETQYNYHYREK
jgi:ribosomal protein S18 acetylase RimI-like enzyme